MTLPLVDFIQSIFMEVILCTRHCDRLWGERTDIDVGQTKLVGLCFLITNGLMTTHLEMLEGFYKITCASMELCILSSLSLIKQQGRNSCEKPCNCLNS